MFDGRYLAVCTARDLGWKRVHGIVHKHSRALEQFFFSAKLTEFFLLVSTMARKVTYEDLKRLQEGQSALAAKVNELQGSLKRIETMLELGYCTSQSQKQIQVQELAEMQDHIQHEIADNHKQLLMEVVQTINKEILSVANNTAAVMNNSKNCFSSSQTSPKQSKFKGFTQFQCFLLHYVLQPCASYLHAARHSARRHKGTVPFSGECPVLWRTRFFRLKGF